MTAHILVSTLALDSFCFDTLLSWPFQRISRIYLSKETLPPSIVCNLQSDNPTFVNRVGCTNAL